MRFENDSSPPPYLNRRDQYRMMGLCGMLLLIVLGIDFTRKPENWQWFFSVGQPQEQIELKELSLDDLDFRVEAENFGTLPHETFIAVADTTPTIDLQELGLDVSRIPPEFLDGVQDKRVGLLRSEKEAMDRVLKRVQALSENELRHAAARDIGYRVVFTDAEKYRGVLMHLEATLWRFQQYPFGDPETTDDDLWQAWLFSSDSGNNPWVVFLTQKPEGVEVGEAINRDVKLAGYFFKNYGYATEDGLHIAPMLIAKTLQLQPLPPPIDAKTENLSLYVFLFLMSIGLVFGLMFWWFLQSDRKFDKSHLAEIAASRHEVSPDFVQSLSELPSPDPSKLQLEGVEGKTE